MPRTDLFPPIEPHSSGHLDLDQVHRMYWEVSGAPEGTPVVFLHGGPGAGCTANHRRFFDPAHYRVVLYDQRGAGRSSPLGETRDNTTAHLVADLETLRAHLGIDRWALFGGSWGSTLALAYATTHPQRVSAMVLRGIFLGRPHEIDWFLNGIGKFFPEVDKAFRGFLTEAERENVLESYHARLTDPDPEVHMPAAAQWSAYEATCSTLLPNQPGITALTRDRTALGLARLEAHYMRNAVFLREDQLLSGARRLGHVPTAIIHGRYDMICPMASAADLAEAMPHARFEIIPDAGHAAMEPGIRRALVGAMEGLKGTL